MGKQQIFNVKHLNTITSICMDYDKITNYNCFLKEWLLSQIILSFFILCQSWQSLGLCQPILELYIFYFNRLSIESVQKEVINQHWPEKDVVAL